MLGGGELCEWLRIALLSAATGGCAYLVLAALLILTFRPRPQAAINTPEPVTVLVPLCGAEPGLAMRLHALCNQNYPAPIQVICGVRSDADTAIAMMKTIIAEEPSNVLELHVDARVYGRNLKISNLINMARYARHNTLVLVDSDIAVGPNFVAEMTRLLQCPGVGAVSSLYCGKAGGGLWAELGAVAMNAHFLPDAILALRLGLAHPCFGAGIALTRETLGRIGGFQAFADRICDDYAIGEAVRSLGREVVVSAAAVTHVCSVRTGRELFASELRAARTARAIAPFGQAGRLIVHPLPLSLAAGLLGAVGPAIALALAALASRALVQWCFARRFGTPLRSYGHLPLGDAIVFAAYATSWLSSDVTWRGHRYSFIGGATVPRA